jgi:hypothetical protein
MPATISKKNLDKINGININFVQNDPDRWEDFIKINFTI